jgi:hypothetical protein
MKKLDITWDGIHDTTGYLFSFAKSLSAAVKNSPYAELSEDIIATSGFAFRMWVHAELCPSAMSIWAFNKQKPWLESGGLICGYIERMWGQDDIEEARRLEAVELIKKSIDNGIAAISWDIGVPEWGLITGYDDETQMLGTLSVTGAAGEMTYNLLGKRELPILNVLTVTGKSDKKQEDIVKDTLGLAASHLNGEEWCDNAKGLAVYPVMISFFEIDNPEYRLCWNMEYYLGTYAALKWYAWKFFEKYNLNELCKLYQKVHDCWQEAFDIKKSSDLSVDGNAKKIAELLNIAYECEKQAVLLMK